MEQSQAEQSLRVYKSISKQILFFYLQGSALVVKAFDKQNPKANLLYACYDRQQLPLSFQVNFSSMQEVLQDIAATSVSNILLLPNNALHIQLQIGSKVKDCVFQMSIKEFTFVDEIEYLLWVTQQDKKQIQTGKADIGEVNRLKLTMERQGREILCLMEQLQKQREKNQDLMQRYENTKQRQALLEQELKTRVTEINVSNQANSEGHFNRLKILQEEVQQLKAELIQLKTKHIEPPAKEEDKDNNNSSKVKDNNPIEVSSKEDQSNRGNAESISSQEYQFYEKFKVQENAVNQSEPSSFYRLGQRFRLIQANQTPKQLSSLHHIAVPRAKVTIRLINTLKHNIWVGLILIERLHLPSTKREKGAISYKLKGGKQLFQDSVRSGLTIPIIHPLEQLSIEVDRLKKKMRWLHGDKTGKETLVCERVIPLGLQGKELYPFVTMIDKGDEIQFA